MQGLKPAWFYKCVFALTQTNETCPRLDAGFQFLGVMHGAAIAAALVAPVAHETPGVEEKLQQTGPGFDPVEMAARW